MCAYQAVRWGWLGFRWSWCRGYIHWLHLLNNVCCTHAGRWLGTATRITEFRAFWSIVYLSSSLLLRSFFLLPSIHFFEILKSHSSDLLFHQIMKLFFSRLNDRSVEKTSYFTYFTSCTCSQCQHPTDLTTKKVNFTPYDPIHDARLWRYICNQHTSHNKIISHLLLIFWFRVLRSDLFIIRDSLNYVYRCNVYTPARN